MRRWSVIGSLVFACGAGLLARPASPPVVPEVVTRRVPDGGIQPRAILDSRGVLHLLYFKGDPPAGDLFYMTSNDLGRTFSPPVRVNTTPASVIGTGTMRGGQMALGRGGRVHVAWMVATTKPAVVRYSRSDLSGRFESERTMPTAMGDLDGPAVAADERGYVYVGWHGHAQNAPGKEESRAVWMRVSADEGKTFAPERPAWTQPTGACGCCGLEFYAARGGGLFILYRAAIESVHRDMYLLESTNHGADFKGTPVQRWDINACPMSSMSFAERGETLYAAWETEGQVYAGAIDRARAAVPSSFAPEKGGQPRKHPRLAIAGDGDVLLAWDDGAGWGKGGQLHYEIFDSRGKPLTKDVSVDALPVWSFGAPIAAPGGTIVLFY
jgi:hypothetical protein